MSSPCAITQASASCPEVHTSSSANARTLPRFRIQRFAGMAREDELPRASPGPLGVLVMVPVKIPRPSGE